MELQFIGHWLTPESSKRQLNKYRFIRDSSGDYIEFMVGTSIAKCDIEQEDLLKTYSWRTHQGFIKTTYREKGTIINTLFKHAVLNITKSHTRVDVKDGDQMNCRRDNLVVVEQEYKEELDYIDAVTPVDTPNIRKRGEWIGGKPGGNITERKASYSVRFTKPTLTKSFSYSSYKTKEECKRVTEQFRRDESDRRGLTKNKIRLLECDDGKIYLEVALNNNLVMICDVEDKHIVERVVWSARASHGTYYAEHSARKGLKLEPERFHRLIVDYNVVDHINGNGLDNRRCNLRCGDKATNVRNARKRKDNKSGVTGVAFTKGAWVVQWPENGKRMSKRFGISYGSLEQAQKAAIEFRMMKNKELNLHPRQ